MKRREFMTLLGAAAWPLAAQAQQAEGMRRVGVLMSTAARKLGRITMPACSILPAIALWALPIEAGAQSLVGIVGHDSPLHRYQIRADRDLTRRAFDVFGEREVMQ